MDFQEVLRGMGRTDILSVPKYIEPVFKYEEKVISFFKDMITNNKRALIYGDYDPDGAYCIQTLEATFESVGYKNYEVFKYWSRTHAVDSKAVNMAITGKFDYMVICDAGSGDPDKLLRLMNFGVKVILLDHHASAYSYEHFGESIAMINTSFDNRDRDEEILVSAGALTFIVTNKVSRSLGRSPVKSNAALALASMYADVIDMSTPLARSIYYMAMNLEPLQLPKLIQRFMGPNVSFSRRFIEFQLNPRLNSLFRAERFDLLNDLLSWKPFCGIDLPSLLEDILTEHAFDSEQTKLASSLIQVEELNNFVIGNLGSVAGNIKIPIDKLHNYTGRVANSLANKYGKTAVVIADSGTAVKGSLRDLYGRNYLDIFRMFSDSNGHDAAFGIHMNYKDVPEFMSYIRMIDFNPKYDLVAIGNEPIIIPYDDPVPSKELIRSMGIYNEFSGKSTPTAFLKKRWVDSNRPYNSVHWYSYRWGDFTVKSYNKLRVGTTLILKPFKGNARKYDGVQLLVHEVEV